MQFGGRWWSGLFDVYKRDVYIIRVATPNGKLLKHLSAGITMMDEQNITKI
jgi:hypothetical protein